MKKIIFIFIFFILIQNVLAIDNNLPKGFVNLYDIDSTILLDLRYFSFHNFVGKPINGYVSNKCILTKKAAIALSKVQHELLEFNLSLKIYDAYRPQRAVNHFIDWAKDISDTLTKKEFYPTIDKSDLFAKGYIGKKSSHTRGSTVDLTIVPLPLMQQEEYNPGDKLCECIKSIEQRFKDNSLDMGAGYDCFHPLSHMANPQIGSQQRANRMLLKTLMEKHGFNSYSKEWWHFTLINEPFPDIYFDFEIR